jgi:hypothetical protein
VPFAKLEPAPNASKHDIIDLTSSPPAKKRAIDRSMPADDPRARYRIHDIIDQIIDEAQKRAIDHSISVHQPPHRCVIDLPYLGQYIEIDLCDPLHRWVGTLHTYYRPAITDNAVELKPTMKTMMIETWKLNRIDSAELLNA